MGALLLLCALLCGELVTRSLACGSCGGGNCSSRVLCLNRFVGIPVSDTFDALAASVDSALAFQCVRTLDFPQDTFKIVLSAHGTIHHRAQYLVGRV
jgi:hypothetical protein